MNSFPAWPSRSVDPGEMTPRSARASSLGRKKTRYSRHLKNLARFLWEQGKTLTHATEKDAAAWVRALKRRARFPKHPIAGARIFRRIAAAHGFFEQIQGRNARNPFARYQNRRSQGPMAGPISLRGRTLQRLVGTMNPDSPWGLRNRAILFLRFGTPLKLSEICRLRRTQLILNGRKSAIRLVRKGGNARKIPLRGPVLGSLRRYLKHKRAKGPYLFQAMPGSLSSSRASKRRRGPRPLSTGWVSSMLVRAQLAAEAARSARSGRAKAAPGTARPKKSRP